jgi:hypothetical protein
MLRWAVFTEATYKVRVSFEVKSLPKYKKEKRLSGVMRTVLAYIIVVPLVQFAFSIGSLPSIPFRLGICWAPKTIRCVIGGLLTGISCALAAVVFGWLVFRYVAGPSSFGTFALAATIIPLYIPIRNDWANYRELREWEENVTDAAREVTSPVGLDSLFLIVGAIVGLALGAYWTQC